MTGHAARGWPSLERTGVGIVVAVLLVVIVALERLDAARETVADIRDAAGEKAALAAGPDLTLAWLGGIGIGVLAASFLGWKLVRSAKTEMKTRAVIFCVVTVVMWVAWALWGVLSDEPSGPRTALQFAVIGMFVVVLLVVANGVVGDIEDGWYKASAVRAEMLLLAALYVLFFIVPLTGDQTAEVLRAWGDEDASRILAGLAGAVLLGVAIRASARRLLELTPPPQTGTTGAECDTSCLAARAEPTAASGDAQQAAAGKHAWVARAICIVVALIASAILFSRSAAAGGTALLLGAAVAIISKPNRRTVDLNIDEPSRRLADTLGLVPLLIVAAGLTVASVDSWLVAATPSVRWRLTGITVGALLLFAVLAGHAYESHAAPERKLRKWPIRLGVAAFGGALLGWLAGEGGGWIAAALLLAVAVVLALRLLGYDSPLAFSTALGVATGVTLKIHQAPVSAARALGVLGCALLVMAGIVVLLHLAALWSERQDMRVPPWTRPWPTRIPLVTLLVIWIVVAFVTAPKTAHQVRTVQRADGAAALSLKDAVANWLRLVPDERSGRPTPMLLVGASGGGTKAAYWTSLVLDCATGGDPPRPHGSGEESSECGEPSGRGRVQQLFLTSSVSGGSIGVLDFIAHLTHDRSIKQTWVDDRVGREVLSPLVAWGLVHDVPALLLGFDTDPNSCYQGGACWSNADRALVQEVAIAGFEEEDNLRGTPGAGILTEPTGGPIPVFNASLNGAAGRLVSSPLDLAPLYAGVEACRARQEDGKPVTGALDAHDVLDPAVDLPLVASAHLSARFPALEPPARVGLETGADVSGCELSPPLSAVRVRDGGYVENTGLLTIADVLPEIRAALDEKRPGTPIIVLSIDDDAAVATPAPALDEEDPVKLTSVGAKVSDDYLTRKARDTITSCQTPNVAYMRISPEPHVGAHAATGWEISETGRRHDLGRSLAAGTAGSKQITTLRRWLDGVDPPDVC